MNENLLKSSDILFVELNSIRIIEIKELSLKSFDRSIDFYIG